MPTTTTTITVTTSTPCPCCGGCSYGSCVFCWYCDWNQESSTWGTITYIGVSCVETADLPAFGVWTQYPTDPPCRYTFCLQGPCCTGDTTPCTTVPTAPTTGTLPDSPLCCCDASIYPGTFAVTLNVPTAAGHTNTGGAPITYTVSYNAIDNAWEGSAGGLSVKLDFVCDNGAAAWGVNFSGGGAPQVYGSTPTDCTPSGATFAPSSGSTGTCMVL